MRQNDITSPSGHGLLNLINQQKLYNFKFHFFLVSCRFRKMFGLSYLAFK